MAEGEWIPGRTDAIMNLFFCKARRWSWRALLFLAGAGIVHLHLLRWMWLTNSRHWLKRRDLRKAFRLLFESSRRDELWWKRELSGGYITYLVSRHCAIVHCLPCLYHRRCGTIDVFSRFHNCFVELDPITLKYFESPAVFRLAPTTHLWSIYPAHQNTSHEGKISLSQAP